MFGITNIFQSFGIMAYSIASLVWIPLGALFLWLSTKIFGVKRAGYFKALGITFMIHFIYGLVLILMYLVPGRVLLKVFLGVFMFLIWFPLSWIIVRNWYGMKWMKALLVWLVWMAFTMILGWVFFILFAFIFAFVAAIVVAL